MSDPTPLAEDQPAEAGVPYRVHEQVGFLLRKASQRHVAIFASHIDQLTPPQFAALSKLWEIGETSQNQLGALIAMDAATIKGVIDRLHARNLVQLARHDVDRRRLMLRLTDEGRRLVEALTPRALRISAETLAPLSRREAATLLRLLERIA
jgi:DNA-binding MarR family transcriptional regulator